MGSSDVVFAEPTVMDKSGLGDSAVPQMSRDCCLIQIYPTDVIDGMQRLVDETITLGRDARCDITVADSNVSRRHAQLVRTEQGYSLTDLQSTNGTFVNEQRVEQVALRGGECLRLGSYIFKFLSTNSIETHYHETVYNAMTRDGLTGAFNKNYLLDALHIELARSRRCGRPLSLIMLDIDHFKSINDNYGHLVGDEVLKEFSERLHNAIRTDDLLCRYGGEEFTIVMGDTSLEEARALGERCRAVIADRLFQTGAGELAVTTSLGVHEASLLPAEIGALDLIHHADEQLYRAKQTGRNRICGPVCA